MVINSMKLKDISNLTWNRSNNQMSLNLRAKQLKKIGITPEQLLTLNIPKTLKIKKVKREVKNKNGTNKSKSSI